MQDTAAAHGNPLGADEVAKVKEILGLPPEDFYVPDDVLLWYREAGRRGAPVARGVGGAPEARRVRGVPHAVAGLHGWEQKLPDVAGRHGARDARRDRRGADRGRRRRPGLVHRRRATSPATPACRSRASARSPPTTRRAASSTSASASTAWARPPTRMAALGLVPCVGTFFVFSDYMRPAVRLASIMQTKVCFVWTHDSVGVGEDGPTHQPDRAARVAAGHARTAGDPPGRRQRGRGGVEGAPRRRRARPRCCSPARRSRCSRARPSARRPGVPAGAYVLVPENRDRPDVVLIGTGSEVQVCVAAREQLAARGIAARVVSMPSWDLFEQQPDDYRVDGAARPACRRSRSRPGVRFGWERYADDVVSIDRFGASAPGDVVMRELGITPEHTVERALALLDAVGPGGS